MAKFITGKQLTNELCNIIREARKNLLIISPYIKLDNYFKYELFNKLKGNASLHILIAFGKNKNNPLKSIKKEDVDYFKEFPNISIVYIPSLHAKYYANENRGLITSVNLYDYSFDNNVEFGVINENSLFGTSNIHKQAWDETMKILSNSYTVFIRRPNYKKKFLMGKDYLGSDTRLDLTQELMNGNLAKKINVFDYMPESYINIKEEDVLTRDEYLLNKNSEVRNNEKKHSATNLGRLKDKSYDDVIKAMMEKGYIKDKNTITNKGIIQGITYKQNTRGDEWIVYPESLSELL